MMMNTERLFIMTVQCSPARSSRVIESVRTENESTNARSGSSLPPSLRQSARAVSVMRDTFKKQLFKIRIFTKPVYKGHFPRGLHFTDSLIKDTVCNSVSRLPRSIPLQKRARNCCSCRRPPSQCKLGKLFLPSRAHVACIIYQLQG